MDIPSIINHNYYVIKARTTNRVWICEAERFDDKESKLYYYYGTYELGSDEHKNNHYLSNSYYDILSSENDEVRLATMEEIDILMDILEKNGVVTTLQETKDKMKNVLAELLEHIKTTPKEDLEREFEEIKEWSNVGPTVEEFITFCECVNRKPKYPTSYNDCCDILGFKNRNKTEQQFLNSCDLYDAELMTKLSMLKVCRDAYWKIAGKEMGLGKPWEPVYVALEDNTYFIIQTFNGEIDKSATSHRNAILAFPTEEMRDTFYENFKELIEECKELL